MPDRRATTTQERRPLSRERVLEAAVAVADEGGIASLTMRRVAEALGVEAMSLYHHVKNKEEILDGVVDVVVQEINRAVAAVERPVAEVGWQAAMRRRILTAREVLMAHPWVPAVIESRTTMSASVLRYHDDLAGLMRQGGFSVDLVHHAMHALGSRALGFTQELFDPADGDDDADAEMMQMLEQMAAEYPHITEVAAGAFHDGEPVLGWCDGQTEFEFGLDLLLDGLERLRAAAEVSAEPDGSAPTA